MKNKTYILRKGTLIKARNGYGYYKCICADNETAIFAPCNKSGTKTNWKKLFAVSAKYKRDENHCNSMGYLFSVEKKQDRAERILNKHEKRILTH